MIAILSPAKTLTYEGPRGIFAPTIPRFATEASQLAAAAAEGLSHERIKKLMGISDALAELNLERFRNFETAPERPAMQAFDGDVYTGLDAGSMNNSNIMFAQDHLRILSGLYGILRPLDNMRPYRLEMGTKWSPAGCKLTTWWANRVAIALAEDAQATASAELTRDSQKPTVLNLASQEYFAVVKGRLPPTVRVVDVEFLAADGRFITMHAKTARGVMARWMIHNHIREIDDMRDFNAAGYRIDNDVSTENQWTFRRSADQVGPPKWSGEGLFL